MNSRALQFGLPLCRCGLVLERDWHLVCPTCFVKLPDNLRIELLASHKEQINSFRHHIAIRACEDFLATLRAGTWKVFQINDCDTWMALTVEDAIKDACRIYYGNDPSPEELANLIDEAVELTGADLDERIFHDDVDLKDTDPRSWRCECGAMGNSSCRWNGSAFEHSHGYPLGHALMTNINRRTFRAELARRVAAGPRVEMFSTTEH